MLLLHAEGGRALVKPLPYAHRVQAVAGDGGGTTERTRSNWSASRQMRAPSALPFASAVRSAMIACPD